MKQKSRQVKLWREENKKPCPLCGVFILPESNHCRSCARSKMPSDMTLKEAIYSSHHRSSAFAKVRFRARTKARSMGLLTKCSQCDFSAHVEVCHIKPIKDFLLETKLSEINAESNLKCLCPNCHWLFDNGHLII